MHNLISHNQLAGWKESIDNCNETDNLINDYFYCLIECDEDQQTCKRICKHMLNT